jgi:PadR family transcriptional regulator, regulatory protein AphA
MQNEVRLSQVSFIVFGLLDSAGEATPYDLKQFVALTLGDLWSIPHAQLYTEPERLAEAGYLSVRQEEGGRRRKHYKLTAKGRKAFRQWVAEPTDEIAEVRDPAVLKLFFGADPKAMAAVQLPARQSRLERFEEMQKLAGLAGDRLPAGMRLALETGLNFEREVVRYWKRLAKGAPPGRG